MLDAPGVAETIESYEPGKLEGVTFPTMNEVVAALRFGRIDMTQTYEDYANFLMRESEFRFRY